MIFFTHTEKAKKMKTDYITDSQKKIDLMNLIMEVKEKDIKRFKKCFKKSRIDGHRINIFFELSNDYQIYFTIVDNPYTESEILTHIAREKAYNKIKWLK
jgi:hypothetical protein